MRSSQMPGAISVASGMRKASSAVHDGSRWRPIPRRRLVRRRCNRRWCDASLPLLAHRSAEQGPVKKLTHKPRQ